MKKVILVIFTIFLVFLVSACNAKTQQADITLGVLTTLSGDYANVLKGVPKAVEYAIEDFQKIHPGLKMKIVYEDDRSCDKVHATTAAQKLINIDNVQGIVGITCSSMMLAIGPIAQENHVLLMSGAASSKEISELGDFNFRTYASDSVRSKAIADVIKLRNYKNVYYVHDNTNDAQVTAIEDIQSFLGEKKEDIKKKTFSVNTQDHDFRTILTKMQGNKADAIVTGFNAPAQTEAFIKQVQEFGITVPLFAPTETIQIKETLDTLQKNELIFALFSFDEENPKYQALVSRYKAETGEETPPLFLAENYDGTMIVLEALYQAKGDVEKARELMHVIGNNYPGASGRITFDENGDVNKPAALMTVKERAFIPYKK